MREKKHSLCSKLFVKLAVKNIFRPTTLALLFCVFPTVNTPFLKKKKKKAVF